MLPFLGRFRTRTIIAWDFRRSFVFSVNKPVLQVPYQTLNFYLNTIWVSIISLMYLKMIGPISMNTPKANNCCKSNKDIGILDLILSVQGREFPAHRCVLAACRWENGLMQRFGIFSLIKHILVVHLKFKSGLFVKFTILSTMWNSAHDFFSLFQHLVRQQVEGPQVHKRTHWNWPMQRLRNLLRFVDFLHI